MTKGLSKFQRCSICNFGSLSPSQYISEKSDRSNKVVYNQTLNEHICLDCEQGIGLPRKKFNVGAQMTVENLGELPLLDIDFDDVEVQEFIEKHPESN